MQSGNGKLELTIALLAGVGLVALCAALAWNLGVADLERLGDVATIIGFGLGVPAAIIGLFNHGRSVRQQAKAELWKRRQFVLEAITAFESNRRVRIAMTLLDYNSRAVVLEEGIPGEPISESDLIAALSPLKRYTRQEALLRDAFDEFFDGLDRLGVMLRAELITWADVEPYLRYWLVLLDPEPRGRSVEFGSVIRNYIDEWHFKDLEGLMKLAGVPVFRPEDRTVAAAVARKTVHSEEKAG